MIRAYAYAANHIECSLRSLDLLSLSLSLSLFRFSLSFSLFLLQTIETSGAAWLKTLTVHFVDACFPAVFHARNDCLERLFKICCTRARNRLTQNGAFEYTLWIQKRNTGRRKIYIRIYIYTYIYIYVESNRLRLHGMLYWAMEPTQLQ